MSQTTSGPAAPTSTSRLLMWWPRGAPTWLTIFGGFTVVGAVALTAALSWPGGPHHFTNTWATVVLGLLASGAALFSAAAAASSSAIATRVHGQQLYELARAVHADFTTGEVAQARDRLGKLVRDRQRALVDASRRAEGTTLRDTLRVLYDDPSTEGERLRELRRDWFTLLWCFQRVYAAYELLAQAPATVAPKGQLSPREFLARLLRSQVKFLNTDLMHARAALEEYFAAPVDDHDSGEAFRDLVGVLLPGVKLGRWADPISTNESQTLREALLGNRSGARIVGIEQLTKCQLDALHHALTAPSHAADREVAIQLLLDAAATMNTDDARKADLEQRAKNIQKPPTSALPAP